jgi:small subunit ribosomal protein S7
MIKAKIKTLTKFTNLLVKKGKKANAFSLVLKTLFLLKKKTKKNPLSLISNVLKTLTPGVTTKKTVIAGRLYHLPSAITRNKALYFSCNWLQQASKENKELQKKTLDVKIAEECLKVLKKKGQSLVLLKQHNKTVSENRPFLRFVRKKYKPRLPRKVWLRKKQLLWLSRRKRFRPKYINTFDYYLDRKTKLYNKKIIFDTRKYAPKTTRRVSKILKKYDGKISRKIIKKKKHKIKMHQLRNPIKYKRLQKLRAIILKRFNNKRLKNGKKNKKFNKKNKFQSRA